MILQHITMPKQPSLGKFWIKVGMKKNSDHEFIDVYYEK